MWKLGVDIGSTTIKFVLLDENNVIQVKHYQRHFSEIREAMLKAAKLLQPYLQNRKFLCTLTGSAGMGLADAMEIAFVQEVIACTKAIKAWNPHTDVIIELGGEDAKLTYLGTAPEQRMNGVCAGGTGSFIDHMAALLHTDAKGLNDLAASGTQMYTIASRCGVFAKTDVQALINDGVSKENIALSILQAVVNQTISNLAQGRPIKGNIAFLGGPLYFLPVLKERFIETLQLAPENVENTPEACYFVAMGAAICPEATALTYADFINRIETAETDKNAINKLPFVLFADEEAYRAFQKRHAQAKVQWGDLANYRGGIDVGIDAGSTTTKLVAIGSNKEILYTYYGSNKGEPLQTAIQAIKELYAQMPKEAYLHCVGTTGYGEFIVKQALHADFGEVETFAHLKAAEDFCPDVSCVLDIGGQDMKCFFVQDGQISQIILNEACSAGCGSFIQNFSQGLSLPVREFAQKGLLASKPVDLGTRCTVFMNSRVKQAQKDGVGVSDISAGIAISVIKNALFKVMQIKDMQKLGEHIVVQGGTFYNDAVLRAMELLTGKEVIRPEIAGLMGAYGVALLATQEKREKSGLLSPELLDNFQIKSRSYHCHGCGNKCLVTMQTFPDGNRYFIGNRCERGAGKEIKVEEKAPNLYAYQYARLFDYYKPLVDAPRGKIGIPRVLNMYEDYPFWFTFFTELGFSVVLSDQSSAKMYYDGMATIPSDSLCYPAKLVHGHIMNLLRKGIKRIFYPCIPNNMKDTTGEADNNFNCPIVGSYAENIRANMKILQEENVELLEPFLPPYSPKHMKKRLYEALHDTLQLDKSEIDKAVDKAYAEEANYKREISQYGQKIVAEIRDNHMPAIVLCGRPYHLDPEINHGIPEMIQNYGIAVISEDALVDIPVRDKKLFVINQWSFHARLYHAAHFVVENPQFNLIHLSSFGCGLDAITSTQTRDILERGKCVYTLIKLDEVNNLGAARIRLRSLMAAWKYGMKQGTTDPLPLPPRPVYTEECREKHTIIVPQLAPLHFAVIEKILQHHNYDVHILAQPKHHDVDEGLQYVHNDMCYPAIIVIGQVIDAFKSGKYSPDKTSVMLFQTCGACRATNYLSMMRRALREAGFPQVPVFACMGLDTDAFKLPESLYLDVMKGMVYGDLLQKVYNRVRPYEKEVGSTDKLLKECIKLCHADLLGTDTYFSYTKTIKQIVQLFDNLPMVGNRKPRVGIVGEVLAKYHPLANNHLERVLLEEGMEVVMPELMDFFLYMSYDDIVHHQLLAGSLWKRYKAEISIKVGEFYRRPLRKALADSKHFTAPPTLKDIAALAKKYLSLGNMAGEGWFLTGEMVKLLQEKVYNIVCLQPFGCLPNHITGKGMIREIIDKNPQANIVSIDCDAGISEVNQLNRIKLMLSVAKEREMTNQSSHEISR